MSTVFCWTPILLGLHYCQSVKLTLPSVRVLQTVGIAVGIAGFVLGVMSAEARHFSFVHGIVGLTVMVLTANQVLIVMM